MARRYFQHDNYRRTPYALNGDDIGLMWTDDPDFNAKTFGLREIDKWEFDRHLKHFKLNKFPSYAARPAELCKLFPREFLHALFSGMLVIEGDYVKMVRTPDEIAKRFKLYYDSRTGDFIAERE